MTVLHSKKPMKACIPYHVAIIMDGNGRWASNRGEPRSIGHKAGIEAVLRTINAATDLGIQYLTLYGFSTENWERPKSEINDLIKLLKLFINREMKRLHQNSIKIRIIGDRNRFGNEICDLLRKAEYKTHTNIGLNLTIALNYGARAEITNAMRKIAYKIEQGIICADAITQEIIEQHLSTAGIPDPDLLIRTSGEQRISNFLLWQSAYTEFFFEEVFWPDFDRIHLEKAINKFSKRERRFGTVI